MFYNKTNGTTHQPPGVQVARVVPPFLVFGFKLRVQLGEELWSAFSVLGKNAHSAGSDTGTPIRNNNIYGRKQSKTPIHISRQQYSLETPATYNHVLGFSSAESKDVDTSL